MSDTAIGWMILAGVCAIVLSLFIADWASGQRGMYAWGLLGPAGWIIAAIRGVHERQNIAVHRAVSETSRILNEMDRLCPTETDTMPVPGDEETPAIPREAMPEK